MLKTNKILNSRNKKNSIILNKILIFIFYNLVCIIINLKYIFSIYLL